MKNANFSSQSVSRSASNLLSMACPPADLKDTWERVPSKELGVMKCLTWKPGFYEVFVPESDPSKQWIPVACCRVSVLLEVLIFSAHLRNGYLQQSC